VRFANCQAVTLGVILVAAVTPAMATTTPKPSAPPHAPPLRVQYPKQPLHTEVVVEVNNKGQVVRVKSAKGSKLNSFNIQTYGNALQMWIRRPDGTAETGLYRVTYDYNPKTLKITRGVALISPGGTWANSEGAADVMITLARKQALEASKKAHAQSGGDYQLPSLNQIRGFSTPKPTPAATLPP
jgi:hypothetical protein